MAARGKGDGLVNYAEIVTMQQQQLQNANAQFNLGQAIGVLEQKAVVLAAGAQYDDEQAIRMEISAKQLELTALQSGFSSIDEKIKVMMLQPRDTSMGRALSSSPPPTESVERTEMQVLVSKLTEALSAVVGSRAPVPSVPSDVVQELLAKIEAKTPVPTLDKTDPQGILTYLPELKKFLNLDCVVKAPTRTRNKLLTTGFSGKVLSEWVTLSSATQEQLLSQETPQFVAWVVGRYFPVHLMDDAYGQYVKSMQHGSLRSFIDTMKERRMLLEMLGRFVSDKDAHTYLVAGFTRETRSELSLFRTYQEANETFDAWLADLDRFLSQRQFGGMPKKSADVFVFDVCGDDGKRDCFGFERQRGTPSVPTCWGCGDQGNQRHQGLWSACKSKGVCVTCGGEHLTKFHSKIPPNALPKNFGKGGKAE
jgi:hypothetical protein